VTKQGAGTLTLTGVNSFSGGITVAGGTLSLGSNSAAGSGTITTTGSVIDYASGVNIANAIVVNSDTTSLQVTTGSSTQAGIISEAGGARPIQKIGAGTLILSSANTYTGGTTISAGTLNVSADDMLGAAGGALNLGGGTLQFGAGFNIGGARSVTLNAGGGAFDTNSFNSTLGQAVGGVGGLTKAGAGTLTLMASETYIGGTTVNAGTLLLGSGGALAAGGNLTVNGGTFDLNSHNQTIGYLSGTGGSLALGSGTLTLGTSNSTTFAGAISGTGALVKQDSGTLTLTGANTFSGGVTLAAGALQVGGGGTAGSLTGNVIDNGTLVFNHSNVFGSVISGSGGVTQDGTGTTTPTGTNTYTGATVVSAGTLSVNGSIASSSGVTVNAGGTLGGTGTLPRTTINGGTLAPGNSIGTLSVNGGLSLTSTAVYAVEVSPTAADRTNVTGPATVAGSLQAIAAGGTYIIGTQYTVLAASGGVSGTFSNISIVGNFGVTRPRIAYDANDVFVVLDPNAISPFLTNGTANQTHIAAAIDKGLAASNIDVIALFNLSGTALPVALDQLTGEIHASVQSALVEAGRFARHAVMERLETSAGPMGAQGTEGPTDPGLWVQGFGSWGTFDGNGNAAASDRNIGGVLAGLDANFGMLRGGVAAGYSQADIRADARDSTADVDGVHVAAYGGAHSEAWNFRFGGAYAWHTIKTSRTVAFSGFSDHDTARYHGQTGQVFGEVGYTLPTGPIALEPYAGFAYVHESTDSFQETGGASALTGNERSNDTAYGTLGITGSSDQRLSGELMVTLYGSLGWQHAFRNIVPSSSLAFVSTSAGFLVSGVPLAQDSALLDFGVELPIGPGASLGVSYAGQFASHFHDNGVEGRFSYRF
jgi:fibronectin-binding autotransporter adhesin